MKTHPAVKFVKVGVGRGTPSVQWPVVRLAGKESGKVYHILDPNTPICGHNGVMSRHISDVDANVTRIDGRDVCQRCRITLGPVPLGVTQA